MKKIKTKCNNLGFTLIELMVALTLFTIVVLAAVSSLYTVNSASRKVEAMRSVLDNLNFAVDSIARTVRTGTDITCGLVPVANATSYPFSGQIPCPSGQLAVKGTLGYQGDVAYDWKDTVGDGCATHCEIRKQVNGGTWVSLTSPEINVKKLQYFVEGTDDPNKQPSVFILIQGVATTETDVAPFSIQTYVSQRSTR